MNFPAIVTVAAAKACRHCSTGRAAGISARKRAANRHARRIVARIVSGIVCDTSAYEAETFETGRLFDAREVI